MGVIWRTRAACLNKTHLFFPAERERAVAREEREAQAKALCAQCPVKAECAHEAIEVAKEHEIHGIWAGQVLDRA